MNRNLYSAIHPHRIRDAHQGVMYGIHNSLANCMNNLLQLTAIVW